MTCWIDHVWKDAIFQLPRDALRQSQPIQKKIARFILHVVTMRVKTFKVPLARLQSPLGLQRLQPLPRFGPCCVTDDLKISLTTLAMKDC